MGRAPAPSNAETADATAPVKAAQSDAVTTPMPPLEHCSTLLVCSPEEPWAPRHTSTAPRTVSRMHGHTTAPDVASSCTRAGPSCASHPKGSSAAGLANASSTTADRLAAAGHSPRPPVLALETHAPMLGKKMHLARLEGKRSATQACGDVIVSQSITHSDPMAVKPTAHSTAGCAVAMSPWSTVAIAAAAVANATARSGGRI
mmetsp:Transcript_21696/g.64816  ORF Transcript_21696/g.64816 Transcript_21696/m.64816 type:complete len:203 (-) Transcript_21696:11-619(-)